MERVFDTIVIGGGTAGCVLAARLSERSSERVALLEAGPDYGPAESGQWPDVLARAPFTLGTHDWGYRAETQAGSIAYYRGRVIGGSSSTNAAGVAWGTRADYDEWGAYGGPGWTFDGLLPYFQRVERSREGSGWFHGQNGPLTVGQNQVNSPYVADLVRAYEACGIPWLDDLNDPDAAEGAGRSYYNLVGVRRVHAAGAYLDPARGRSNLTILDTTIVRSVDWHGDPLGVSIEREGTRELLRAGRVVLCAGAVGSPALLQRSGIGDSNYLKTVLDSSVPLLHLPGVGQNLWDHPGVAVEFHANEQAYERLKTVFSSSNMVREQQVMGKVKSDDSLAWFDLNLIQWHGLRPPGHPEHRLLRFPLFLVHPSTSGWIRIESPDPERQPRVHTGWGMGADAAALASGVELVRRISNHPDVRSWFGPETVPGGGIDRGDLEGWVADNFRTYNHCCGTARVGSPGDPLAVVDAAGRVHGFDNLFVADASILPRVPRAAINLTVYAVAEKIAAGIMGASLQERDEGDATAPPGSRPPHPESQPG